MDLSTKRSPGAVLGRFGSTGDLPRSELGMKNSNPLNALQGKAASAPGGCLIWQRALNSRGYGVVWFDGKVRLAHRVAFYGHHGRWPAEDMVIDHACNTKACINPDHLREMENWRNLRRAGAPGTPEQEHKREMWRRANSRRRNYSPTWTAERGG